MRSRPPSRRPTPRRPSRPRRERRTVPSRSPRYRHSRDTGFQLPSWGWIAAIVGGVIILAAGVFFAVSALSGGKQTTAITPSIPPTTTTIPDETPTASTATATPPTATTSPPTSVPRTEPDIPALQQFMHVLVNDDRKSNGRSELGWDSTAASAGLLHAKEMARYNYLSHWDLDGHGPDYRYSMAGGLDYVMENVYIYTHTLGMEPSTMEGWQDLIRQAEQALMDSPGHRANILTPEHTHVGIGIAYESDASGWRLTIAQEFINKYLTLQPVPHRVSLGDTVTISGKVTSGNLSDLLINLAYEPFPAPMSVDALNNTSTYSSPAETYDDMLLDVDSSGRFGQEITLDYSSQPGLYHIRIWGNIESGEQIQVSDIVVEVQ